MDGLPFGLIVVTLVAEIASLGGEHPLEGAAMGVVTGYAPLLDDGVQGIPRPDGLLTVAQRAELVSRRGETKARLFARMIPAGGGMAELALTCRHRAVRIPCFAQIAMAFSGKTARLRRRGRAAKQHQEQTDDKTAPDPAQPEFKSLPGEESEPFGYPGIIH